METRSRTATAGNAAADFGFKITSTRPLRGSKQSKSVKQLRAKIKQVKKKTNKIKEKAAIVKQKTKETKKKIGSENDLAAKARRKLDALFREKEQAIHELEKQGVKISVDDNNAVKEVVIPPHEAAVRPMKALGMQPKGEPRKVCVWIEWASRTRRFYLIHMRRQLTRKS
jgi:seryl-tRNA synthetase